MPKKNLTVLAKNKAKPGPIAKFKRVFKKHLWLSIICSALLLWGLVWLGQVAVERYQFAQAEKKLSSFNIIGSEHKKKISDEKRKNCNYSSEKFGRGTLRCSVYRILRYQVLSIDEANELVANVEKSQKDNKDIDQSSVLYGGNKKFSGKNMQKTLSINDIGSSFRFKNLSNPKCHIQQKLIQLNDFLQYEVSVGCTKEAKLEYFSVQ